MSEPSANLSLYLQARLLCSVLVSVFYLSLMHRGSFHFLLSVFPKAMETPSILCKFSPEVWVKALQIILTHCSWKPFSQLICCGRGSPHLGDPGESVPIIHRSNLKTMPEYWSLFPLCLIFSTP